MLRTNHSQLPVRAPAQRHTFCACASVEITFIIVKSTCALRFSDSVFGEALNEQFQPSAEAPAPAVLMRLAEELEKRIQETGNRLVDRDVSINIG